jgi:hypothetical protein
MCRVRLRCVGHLAFLHAAPRRQSAAAR